jgi:hypothetical protein
MIMKGKSVILWCVLASAVLALLCGPVSAVVLESAYTGKVSAVNQAAGTMTIDVTSRYGIDYTGDKAVGSWNPVTPVSLKGAVPDKAVYNLVNIGDTVRAVQMGDTTGPWITIAKVNLSEKTAVVQNIIGEPQEYFANLFKGNYTVSYTTTADCAKYNKSMGTVAPALSATVVLQKDGKTVMTKTLKPGKGTVYKDKSGASFSILFAKGQSDSSKCRSGSGMMTGIQPISVFVITPVTPTK